MGGGDAEPVVTQLDFHSVAPMIPLYKTKAYRVSNTAPVDPAFYYHYHE